jgi:hypothetical protein
MGSRHLLQGASIGTSDLRIDIAPTKIPVITNLSPPLAGKIIRSQSLASVSP